MEFGQAGIHIGLHEHKYTHRPTYVNALKAWALHTYTNVHAEANIRNLVFAAEGYVSTDNDCGPWSHHRPI